MYALILDKDRMAKLWRLREKRKKNGEKSTIIGMIKEATDRYLTDEEEKEIKRVCGENYEESDIPAYIRQRHDKPKQKGVPRKEDSQEKV